jgi:CDP-diacylglycerol--glycerol-3-phosphate 3-phosphatidyltransferase
VEIMAQLAARDLWRIPGLLSLSRIPLAALFVAWTSSPPAAIAVLLLAAATDIADGWFARRFHEETPTGRVLDPITDKIFVATVVVALVTSRILSFGEALLLGMRELCEVPLMLLFIRGRQRRHQPVRGANRLGKVATAMQFTSIAIILLDSPHRRWWVLSTAFLGVLAGLSYAIREWRHRAPSSSEVTG